MLANVFRKIFGSRNDRVVKRYMKTVEKINQMEPAFESLSDEELRAKTDEFKRRYSDGESLDALLPEAFAAVREAGKRVLGMRHFDVQLVGGMVLHAGKIAEMRTGEGKTLVATLAVYLNALAGKGVHVVTVNDYLATRDAEWMGKLYGFLGLSTGVSIGGMDNDAKRAAYSADITYGTNNEFGFDYLRDNMAFSAEAKVQRGLSFAVVDEVDSILIDEARTPLVISGAVDENSELHVRFTSVVDKMVRGKHRETKEDDEEGDYSVDEKSRSVHVTEQGHQKVEEILSEMGLLPEGESLYSTNNLQLLHYLNAALRAKAVFQKDVHYIVQNNSVVIVDEFTGRTMPGRRWGEGTHQAIEAKEGLPIQSETQTMASITFQNYFRLYDTLSGMTGTADTEAPELLQIYGLEVVVIPTNKPMQRIDMPDKVYLSIEEKYEAVVDDIQDCVRRGQPVLVGTASIEASEAIANILKKRKVDHEVLNAKQHEREANIIQNAGLPGAVTIATNMAGRGTDIVLGGNLEAALDTVEDEAERLKIENDWHERHRQVLDAGGLHVIGSERHESRRVDNQLRGRSGRQGDAGSSRFYLSLQDDLMRIFASDRVGNMMKKLGMQRGEAIEHPWVTRAIENAQRKVEGHNFDIRKNILEFDDVANDQRRVIYEQRNEMMEANDMSEAVTNMREDVINQIVSSFIMPGSIDEQWDITGLEEACVDEFGLKIPVQEWLDKEDMLGETQIRQRILQLIIDEYARKEELVGAEGMRRFEKAIMLQTLDTHWKGHLAAMDYLRQSIGLRGYAQKNPKQEYKRESFEMFTEMLDKVKYEVISTLMKVQIKEPEEVDTLESSAGQGVDNMSYKHESASAMGEGEGDADTKDEPERRRKIGRNDPCYCGSGKKYKQCHGKLS